MRHASASVAAAWLSASTMAAAQPAAEVARRALIEEATAAARAGDHARAIELGDRAAAIRVSPSLRYLLAREHLALGHAVDALDHAGACIARARGDATVPDRDALLQRCEDIAREAERGVARLTVHVPSPAPEGLRVTVAGAPLDPALVDIPLPQTPGAVAVSATAPGHEALQRSLTLAAGERYTLDVVLAPAPVVAPPPVETPPVEAPPRRVAPPAAASGAAPWIFGGVGLAAIVAGGILGGLSLDAQSRRDAACPPDGACDVPTAIDLDARGRDLALGANVAFATGGALLLGGVVWWAVARVSRRSSRVAVEGARIALRW